MRVRFGDGAWFRWRAVGVLAAVASAFAVLFALNASGKTSGPRAASQASAQTQAAREAQKRVNTATGIPQFRFHGPRFAASKAHGKTIFDIPLSSSDPYVAEIDAQMETVAKRTGVKFIDFKNQGTTAEQASGIQQAIARKANVIILNNLGPEALLPQLRAAKAAGIRVVVSHWYQNGTPPERAVKPLVSALVTGPFAQAGRLSMDYAIAHTKGDIHSLIITDNEFPISATIVRAMKRELAGVCPRCEKPQVVNVPLAHWTTSMSSTVQSELTQNPNINVILPVYDSMSIGVEAGISASGRAGDVSITSYNGTPSILKLLESGNIMVADVGESPEWIAYATMDQALRLAAGVKPIAGGDESTPLRVFDHQNIAQTGTPPQPGRGYGAAYVKGYDKIWELSGR